MNGSGLDGFCFSCSCSWSFPSISDISAAVPGSVDVDDDAGIGFFAREGQ